MLSTSSALTILAVLIRIVANPLANVFQKQLTQRTANPLFVIGATYGFLTLVCLPFSSQLQFTGLSAMFWQNILLTSSFAVIGNVFLVRALHIGDLSVLGPINAYKAVVGMIVSVFLLNEIPGWWGLAGLLLIITGSYVVLNYDQTSFPLQSGNSSLFQRPAVKLRLAALVFSAIDGAFLKKAIIQSTPVTAFFYWCLLGFLFTFIWLLTTMRSQWRAQLQLLFSQKLTYTALVLSVGITQLASNVALAGMPVGYALALFQTSALVSVLFGYQFFQEKGIIRKLIGASIMIAGAVLITVLG